MLYVPTPDYEQGLRLQSRYRAYRVVAGKVLIQGEAPTLICGELVHGREPWVNDWILLDIHNGNPELGYGYCWVFKTRQQAREHRNRQNAHPALAHVTGPWRVGEAKRHFLRLHQRPLRGRSQLRS